MSTNGVKITDSIIGKTIETDHVNDLFKMSPSSTFSQMQNQLHNGDISDEPEIEIYNDIEGVNLDELNVPKTVPKRSVKRTQRPKRTIRKEPVINVIEGKEYQAPQTARVKKRFYAKRGKPVRAGKRTGPKRYFSRKQQQQKQTARQINEGYIASLRSMNEKITAQNKGLGTFIGKMLIDPIDPQMPETLPILQWLKVRINATGTYIGIEF